MEYLVGIGLALGTGVFASATGFDRDRAFYPAALIVIAAYYDLFAVMGGGAALGAELAVTAAFILAAVIGFRTNLWIVALALIGHGLLDLVHGQVIANEGVPAWWPMFCASFDVIAGLYLGWRLTSKQVDATDPRSFGKRIRLHVDAELSAAAAAELAGDPSTAFAHLERAHVLSQRSTVQHVRVHVRMLMWALRRRDLREGMGQLVRVIGAATKTWVGLVPDGNTGGANVSAFKTMALPDDLAGLIAAARTRQQVRE
jgi:hypothetical protein